MIFLFYSKVWTLALCTRSVASIDSFEVIFEQFFAHIGRYISLILTNLGFLRAFASPHKKNLMVSNRMILVASWYRHDDELRGQQMSLAINPYSLEFCGMWHPSCSNHICSKSYSSIAVKKIDYHMTTMLRIDDDSRSIVIFEEVKSNHIFWPKSAPNSDFFWM